MKNLFGPAAWRWEKDIYGEPFNKEKAPKALSGSIYDAGIGKASTGKELSGLVLQALQRLEFIRENQTFGCLVSARDETYLVEMENTAPLDFKHMYDAPEECKEDRDRERVQVMYTPKTGKFRARLLGSGKAGAESRELSYRGNEVYFFMAAAYAGVMQDPEGEAGGLFESFVSTHDADAAVRLSCNLFARNVYPDPCDLKYPGSGLRTDPDHVDLLLEKDIIKTWAEAEEHTGEVTGADAMPAVPVEKEPDNKDILSGRYALSNKKLTPDEQMLVPQIPESYQIGEIHEKVARIIKRSTDLPNPVRNFIFVGEAGSGKTEAVKIEAMLANKPLLHQSMDPDTDKFDVCQQVIPDGNGGFAYVEGPLVEALEKGWFCEVSEADLILKQGALGYLNPLLDKTGTLRLNTGRLVVRHPEAVLFFTINGNYEGCRPMNKAVKDRCMIIGFEKPDDKTLISRVISESGLKERGTVKKMVDVMHKVEDHCAVNCLDDGVVGIRSLIRWATAVACGEDPWTVAKESLVYSWTFDKSEHEALLKCVETQFAPGEVKL